jgi:formylglycine-generating enzyme required for sulfatase activity
MHPCCYFFNVCRNLLLFVLLALTACSPPEKPDEPHGPADEVPRTDDLHARVVEVEIAKGVTMEFCWIPRGEAQLGSPTLERQKIGQWERSSILPVQLSSEPEDVRGKFSTDGFWLGKYVVTQEQWQALMGKNPSRFVPTEDAIKKAGITDTRRFPVERVSWDQFAGFLKKLNEEAKVPEAMGKGKFSLPHENEWEYACRGDRDNARPFYFGNALDGTLANCQGNHPFGTSKNGPDLERTCEVGRYEKAAPHPWGLCDMHGNVAQWCANAFSDENNSPALRGGSWSDPAVSCRSAYRDWHASHCEVSHIGFRACFRPE